MDANTGGVLHAFPVFAAPTRQRSKGYSGGTARGQWPCMPTTQAPACVHAWTHPGLHGRAPQHAAKHAGHASTPGSVRRACIMQEPPRGLPRAEALLGWAGPRTALGHTGGEVARSCANPSG